MNSEGTKFFTTYWQTGVLVLGLLLAPFTGMLLPDGASRLETLRLANYNWANRHGQAVERENMYPKVHSAIQNLNSYAYFYQLSNKDRRIFICHEKITFQSLHRAEGLTEIYIMNTDGTGLTNLTNHPAQDGSPAWSPDGSKIAFASDRHRNSMFQIYVMNDDGTGVTRLTDNRNSEHHPT